MPREAWSRVQTRERAVGPAAEPAARCSYCESFSPKNCMSKNNLVVAFCQAGADGEMAVRNFGRRVLA